MAFYGLSNPYIAKYNADGSYETGMNLGEGISTEVTPSYAEGKLYADNAQKESVKEFTSASVTIGTTRVPAAAVPILFGHTVESSTGDETSNANDSAGYFGYGFIVKKIENGNFKYQGCVLLKVQAAEGTESYQTKGDSVTFQTPSLSGSAMAIANGDWRVKSGDLDSEEAALAWIKTKLA